MYNRVILMGRLVADPELRQTQSGIAMCRFRIAVDRGYAKQGEEKKADFIQVQCWRQTAEFVSKYFSKGRMIHLEGRLQNNDYTDNNGVKHYGMDVVADNVSFCGDKASNQQGGYTPQPQYQQTAAAPQYNQPSVPQPVELGNLDDFEEVLSDGEVPF